MFTGQIAMWSGALGTVPAGWQLCDGTNGTPNLEQKFVIGSQGGLAIGAIGGNAGHSHAFTTDGHWHNLAFGGNLQGGADYRAASTTDADTGTTSVTPNTPPWYTLAFIMRMI